MEEKMVQLEVSPKSVLRHSSMEPHLIPFLDIDHLQIG